MSRIHSPSTYSSVTTVIADSAVAGPPLELHLNAGEEESTTSSRPAVRWTEDVIDNEHLNRKKSKVCCIFHKNRAFGESSSESSSSSSSESESDSDFGGFGDEAKKQPISKKNKSDDKKSGDEESDEGVATHHDHGDGSSCNHDHAASAAQRRQARLKEKKLRQQARAASPNAYERQPKYRSANPSSSSSAAKETKSDDVKK